MSFRNKKCYDTGCQQTLYHSFNNKNIQLCESLKQINGIYYVNPFFFNDLLKVNSLTILYEELYQLVELNDDHNIVQKQWVNYWNNNFSFFNDTKCSDSWTACNCSFHRHKRWNSSKDKSLIYNCIELLFWENDSFYFSQDNLKAEKVFYSLDKEQIIFYCLQNNWDALKLVNSKKKKQRFALQQRLNYFLNELIKENLFNLVYSTFKFDEFLELKKVKEAIEKHLSRHAFTFFIFFELDKCKVKCHNSEDYHNSKNCFCETRHFCIRKWHLHILHSNQVNILENWEYSNNIHQTEIIPQEDIQEVIYYLTKNWASYIFLSLEKYGLKKSDKFYWKTKGKSRETMQIIKAKRIEYKKDWEKSNKEKRSARKKELRRMKKQSIFNKPI